MYADLDGLHVVSVDKNKHFNELTPCNLTKFNDLGACFFRAPGNRRQFSFWIASELPDDQLHRIPALVSK